MRPAANLDKRFLMGMALVTLVGFPLLGMGIVKLFSDHPIQIMMRQRIGIPEQFLFGIGIGTVMGFISHYVSELPFIRPSTAKYGQRLQGLELNTIDKVLISICAGFGEELLFRGAIQVFYGIWPTAIIFVAIHGYLNPKDWRISSYGVLMCVFIGIMGYMMEYWGIWSAIAAHVMVDLVLLWRMEEKEVKLDTGQGLDSK